MFGIKERLGTDFIQCILILASPLATTLPMAFAMPVSEVRSKFASRMKSPILMSSKIFSEELFFAVGHLLRSGKGSSSDLSMEVSSFSS
ncbi:hypothetical protein D3C76_1565100 [compost metagenome]